MSDSDNSGGNSGAKGAHPGKENLIPWKKGQSGNPGGRPKGLAHRVREMTRDGADLLELLAGIASGSIKATPRDRIDATKTLLERGWGRAPEVSVSLTANASSEQLEALADGALEELARALSGPSSPHALPAETVDRTVSEAEFEPIPSDSLKKSP